MKTPAILHRVSFFVILNSLIIIVAVVSVGIENNQLKNNRLVSYRYDFINDYYRAEIADIMMDSDREQSTGEISPENFNNLFEHSQQFMRGLCGLTMLSKQPGSTEHRILLSSFRDTLKYLEEDILGKFNREISPKTLDFSGYHLGSRFNSVAGKTQVVYIPIVDGNYDMIMAVTIIPKEITGSIYAYNNTVIILFLAITLITLLIVNLLFKDYIKPLQHLIMGMEKTAAGEVLYTIEDARENEIGRVTGAFNVMSSSLWKQRKQFNETFEKLSEANQSLKESEAVLSKFIASSPFAIIAATPDKKITLFNQAAESNFGVNQSDVLSKNLLDFFPYAPERVFPQSDEETGLVQAEMICQKQNGEHFPVLVNRAIIRESDSEISAYLFIIRDISESKNFQEMMISLDRMATRGVMAGEIAHEINNYLAIILGNVELVPLLLSKGKMEMVDKKLGVLKTTVSKIQKFSEGLMGFGSDDVVFTLEDLNQMIENLITFLKPQNHYDNINFDLRLSRELPLVEFGGSQLQQMFVNLLNNAAHSLRENEGEKKITITTEFEASTELVKIMVSDNGEGLPDDIHEVIFKSRYNGRRNGRGFGLIIVKRMIDLHNGDISYESQPEEGASFIITFPVRKPKEKPAIEDSLAQVTT